MSDNKEMTWDEYSQALDTLEKSRKTVTFDLPHGKITFTIKKLTQREYDQARSKLSMHPGRKKGKSKMPLNMGDFNREVIRHGVVSGPKGFSAKNNAHIERMDVEVRDELANCIDEFSTLPDEVRVSFRDSGPERESLQVDAQ